MISGNCPTTSFYGYIGVGEQLLFFLMKFGSVRGDAHAHIGGDRRRSIAFRMELII